MKRKVSAMEARRKFGEILEGVYYRGDEVTVERAGKPMGVIVSPAQYQVLQQGRDRLYKLFEESWQRVGGEMSYEEAERIAVQAVRDVRQKRTRASRRSA